MGKACGARIKIENSSFKFQDSKLRLRLTLTSPKALAAGKQFLFFSVFSVILSASNRKAM